MTNTLENKLISVRQEATVIIKDMLNEIGVTKVMCTDFCTSTPMVTPTQSLDSIELKDTKLYFSASGEYDNNDYIEEEVSTDFLVDLVNFLDYYREEIEEYKEEEDEDDE